MNVAVRRAAGLAAHLCASCLILSTVPAEEYSWQVSGSYRDETAGSTVRIQDRLLRATYYLSPVDDAAGPYELAPFLNRSSYVAIGAGRRKLREETYLNLTTLPGIGSNDTLTVEPNSLYRFGSVDASLSAFSSASGFDTSDYAVGGRYVWPASGWYAGARARRDDGDAAPLLPLLRTTAEFRRNGFLAGRYFGPRTAVEVDIGSATNGREVRMNVPGFDPLFALPQPPDVWGDALIVDYEFGFVTEVETDDAGISVRHVGDLGGSTFALSAALSASRSQARFTLHTPPELVAWGDPADWPVGRPAGPFPAFAPAELYPTQREREVRISGALFPVESLGVWLSVSTSDHDAYGTRDRVDLSVNWFFVRNAAVEVELSRSGSVRSYGPDSRATNSVGVRLLGRF